MTLIDIKKYNQFLPDLSNMAAVVNRFHTEKQYAELLETEVNYFIIYTFEKNY